MSIRRNFIKAALLASPALPLAAHCAQPPASARPKIGMIGSGNVGSNLGKAWVSKGYTVMSSSNDMEADRRLAAQIGSGALAGTPQEAATFGDVLVFAVPCGALPEPGKSLGSALKTSLELRMPAVAAAGPPAE